MKKIIAFVCALTVLATSAAGWNLAHSVEAAGTGNAEVTPITLPGFTTITTKDFVDANGAPMSASKKYTATESFTLKDREDFDKTLLTLKVKFEALSASDRIEFFGKDDNAFYYIYPSEANRLMLAPNAANTITNMGDPYFSLWLSNLPAGTVSSTINEEYILQIATEYKSNNVVEVSVYMNGQLVRTCSVDSCNMDKFGNRLTVRYDSSPVTVSGVGVEEEEKELPSVTLPGFTTITTKDFVDDNGDPMSASKKYTATESFTLKDREDFDKTLLTLKVRFEALSASDRIEFFGKDDNAFYYIYPSEANRLMLAPNAANTITNMGDPYFSLWLSNLPAGTVSSTINEEYILQIATEYKSNNVVEVSVYMNGQLVRTCSVDSCNMDKFGNRLTVRYDNSPITVSGVGVEEEEKELPSVTLPGFTTITTKDFVDANGDPMSASKKYTATESFTLKDREDFDKTLLTFKVKFEATGASNRIEFFGKDDNAFYYVYPSEANRLMLAPNAANTITNMGDPYFSLWLSNLPEGTVSSTINEEYILQIATEYKSNNVVEVSVYINGQLVRTCSVDSCNMDKFGNRLTVRYDSSPITISGVGLQEEEEEKELPTVTLQGFTTISTDDFVDENNNAMQSKKYTSTEAFTLKAHENYDKKLLTFKVKFEEASASSRIEFLGADDTAFYYVYPASTSMLRLHPNAGNTITNMGDPYFGLDFANLPAGTVTSAINEEYMLQISTEYKEDNLVQISVYVNGECVRACVVDSCNMEKFGNRLTIRVDGAPITITGVKTEGSNSGGNEGGGNEGDDQDEPKEPIQLDGFKTISVGDFIDASGNDMQGKIYMNTSSYTLKDFDSFDKTLLSFKTTYTKGTTNLRIEFGGKDTTSAFIVYISEDGKQLYFTQSNWGESTRLAEDPFNSIDAVKAGVDSFLNKEVIIQFSIEYGDFEGNDGADDMRIGFYFDGKAYPFDDGTNYRIIKNCNMSNFGDVLTIYSDGDPIAVYGLDAETGGEIVIPEMSGPLSEDCKKITLKHFGIEDGTYGHSPDDGFAIEGKTKTSLTKTAVCGEMLLKSGDEYTICSSGKGGWQGLFIKVGANGDFTACWRNATVEKVFFGRGTIPMDKWVNFMFSTEVMDIDGDGVEDDIKLGIWIDGKLMEDKYFPATDCAEDLGDFFGIYCPEGYTVSLRSIPELIEPFDYSVYGLTENWASTLLNTGLTAKIPVGGSKESGPFSGDYTSIMLYAVAFVISLGGLGFYGYRRKKK